MLQMDEIDDIKTRFRNGQSKSEISRITGRSRATVRKVIETVPQLKCPIPKRRQGKGHIYREAIEQYLDQIASNTSVKDRLTAKRIYELLVQDEAQQGNQVLISLRTVQRTVKELRTAKRNENSASLKLYHRPGKAQVDFGEVNVIRNHRTEKAMILVLTLPYSNAKFARLLPAQNQECLFAGLADIFQELNGVPESIRFDNMSTAVTKILTAEGALNSDKCVYWHDGRPRVLTERFRYFQSGYQFQSEFCNPSSGNEKGSVENAVGWFRNNMFCPTLEICSDYQSFNVQVLRPFCQKQRESLHYKKNRLIKELFAEDKVRFLPLRSGVPTGRWESRVTDQYGRIHFDKNTYQLDVKPDREVDVYLEWDALTVTVDNGSGGQQTTRLTRSYDNGKDFIDWTVELRALTRKGQAIKDSVFRKILLPKGQAYVDGLKAEQRRSLLNAFLSLLKNNDIYDLRDRLERALEINVAGNLDDVICSIRGDGEIPINDRKPMEGDFGAFAKEVPSDEANLHVLAGQVGVLGGINSARAN